MIVLKHNGVVYIAQSCWKIGDVDDGTENQLCKENISMWHPSNRRNRLMATSIRSRFTDVIRYENIFPKVFDRKHLAFETYENMAALSNAFGLFGNGKLQCRTVFAEGDRAFVMDKMGGMMEVEDVLFDTPNDDIAIGLYDLNEISDPYKFIKSVFENTEAMGTYRMFPIAVMSTKDNKLKIINR